MGSRKGAFCFTWSHYAKAFQRDVRRIVCDVSGHGCGIGLALHQDPCINQALHQRVKDRADRDDH